MADPDKGWQLPTDVYPTENWCYTIQVPKDIAYLRALRGAVGDLQYHWNWQRDENDTAEQVATVWRERINEAENALIDGDCGMPTCEEIISCITNDPATREAVIQAVKGMTDTPALPSIYTQFAFDESAACDYDAVWGYCKALWEFIDAQTVDFLEQLQEATNAADQIKTLISLIPGFEFVPIADVLEWITNLGEYNLDAYNASKTTAIENQIICGLFCIATSNDCHITFGQVYDYMLEQMGGANLPTLGATFAELVFFMITGNYLTDRIIYLWSFIQLGMVFVGAEFLGLNTVQPYAVAAQLGDPDTDWMLLCDECGENYLITFDTLTDDDWSVAEWVNPAYNYDVATVIQSSENGDPQPSSKAARIHQPSNGFRGLGEWIEVTLENVSTVSNVNFWYYYDSVFGSNVLARSITMFDDQGTVLDSFSTSANDAPKLSWEQFSHTPASPVADVKVIRVHISVVGGGTTYANTYGFIDNIAIAATVTP